MSPAPATDTEVANETDTGTVTGDQAPVTPVAGVVAASGAAGAVTEAATPGEGGERLLSIGAAAAQAGVTERSLRYYQELGLLVPSALTKGGMRRYSQADLDRVARIRELQAVIGLNLDEIAGVLRGEDRIAQIKAEYGEEGLTADHRRQLLDEYLDLALGLRSVVEAKRAAIDAFVTDLDGRIGRIRAAIDGVSSPADSG